MASILKKREIDARRKDRARKKVKAVNKSGRMRIFLNITNRHMYVQMIDDNTGKTLFGTSTEDSSVKQPGKNMANKENAVKLADVFAGKFSGSNIDPAAGYVFDRGGRRYHGKVKAFADTLREKGVAI